MATKRGQQDGGKPADAAQGVAPVPTQSETQTPPQAEVAGLPELTREAYEAIVATNTDLAAKLAEAEGREKVALAVIERLTAAGDDMAKQIEAMAAHAPAPKADPDEKSAVANLFGLRREQVLSFSARVGRVTCVTIDGRKLVRDL